MKELTVNEMQDVNGGLIGALYFAFLAGYCAGIILHEVMH